MADHTCNRAIFETNYGIIYVYPGGDMEEESCKKTALQSKKTM